MIQAKIFIESNSKELEKELNNFLKELNHSQIKTVLYQDLELSSSVLIIYDV